MHVESANCGEDLLFFFLGLQIEVKTFFGPNNFSSSVSEPLLKLVEYRWYIVYSEKRKNNNRRKMLIAVHHYSSQRRS